MRLDADQRGQALVAVMVVMLILFALAGAVAVGATTLFANRGSGAPGNDDFRVRSALNDAVAQVAGVTNLCNAPPPPSPLPTPVPTPTQPPLTLTLPSPDVPTQGQCAREDDVQPDTVTSVALNGCNTYDLSISGPARVAAILDLHATSNSWAYLSTDATKPSGFRCASANLPLGEVPPCATSWRSAANTVLQETLTCDIPANQKAYLHTNAPATAVQHAWIAEQDPSATDPSAVGALYALVIHTPVSSPALEEAVLYVSGDGKFNRLVSEAPLP